MTVAGVLAALTLATTPVQAQTVWKAILAPEASGATGTGNAEFLLNGSILTITSVWSGLSGNTTVAHIHCCTASPGTGTVGVAVTPGTLPGFPTGVTSGVYSVNLDLSLATSFTNAFVNNFAGGVLGNAQAALVAGFNSNKAYFNIHSSKFPGGEIRGFITPVPEPASVALLAIGIVGLAVPAAMRRRSRAASL